MSENDNENDNSRQAIREVKYPELKQPPKDETFDRLHDLPDEKKFDYSYWDRFLNSHKKGPVRWQLFLIPALIILIGMLYRHKIDEIKVPLINKPSPKSIEKAYR